MATQVLTALEEISREEELLSKKVDNLLSNAGNLTRSLRKLDLLRAQSQSLQVGSSYLLSTLEATASTAERISSNVRGLDAEQSRVKETLKYVDEVKELKTCVSGVHESMEAQTWEVAAEYVHRASLVPTQIAQGKFAALMVPSAETPLSPAETIREASEQLFHLFTRQFQEAAKSRDARLITRFFKLFPQIDKADEGLDLYADFVSGIIAERSDQALNTASTSPILYASLMTSLFEHIATLITNHTPLITRFYGKDIDRVLAKIQNECDKQGILILTTLAEDRQLTKKVSEIKSYSFSFLVQSFLPLVKDNSQAPEEREVDSKALDALLTEVSIVFSRWSLYNNFMRRCATADEPAFLQKNALAAFLNTKLESDYETMEAYFMRRSVERAFQLESTETAETGYQISSVVDDVMFILRKVTLRALSTGQVKTVSSIFAVVRRILEQDYAGVLGRRMQELQNRIAGPKTGVVKSIDAERRDRMAYCTLINDLDISADTIAKISAEQSNSPMLQEYPTPEERESALRIIEVLGTLNDRFSRGVEDGIAVLYNAAIKNRIRTTVNDAFAGQIYHLDPSVGQDTQQQQQQQQAPFSQKFAQEWAALITDPFEGLLTPSAYETLLTSVVRAFIRVLEKKLLTIKVTELGAIALDRDISALINIVTGQERYHGLRDKFERVREISSVVNFTLDDGDEESRAAGTETRTEGEMILTTLGLRRIGVEEIEMIRREMLVRSY